MGHTGMGTDFSTLCQETNLGICFVSCWGESVALQLSLYNSKYIYSIILWHIHRAIHQFMPLVHCTFPSVMYLNYCFNYTIVKTLRTLYPLRFTSSTPYSCLLSLYSFNSRITWWYLCNIMQCITSFTKFQSTYLLHASAIN